MRIRTVALLSTICISMAAAPLANAARIKSTLKKGTPDVKSVGPIAFGPENVLFLADPLSAAVFAIDTEDAKAEGGEHLDIERLDTRVAALLGTTSKEIRIVDLAVNPATGNAFLSVSRGTGPDAAPVIVKVARDGKISLVEFKSLKFAKAELPDAPSLEKKDRRGNRTRLESITDIAYVDDRLLVAGLSNEEFASTLRSIPLPFDKNTKGTSVEIYHGAHGRFETRSPVRTFVPFKIEGETHVLAAYTCTPLVKFPLKSLKPGEHLKGTTIAELGNRNRPLDMISYSKDGKQFLLLANNSRGVMKIGTEKLDKAEAIVERVGGGGTKGVGYETVADWKGIHQLDKLDDSHALVVRRDDSGAFHLESRHLP